MVACGNRLVLEKKEEPMLTPPQRDEDRENLLSKTNISDSTCGIRCTVVYHAGVP